MLGGLAWFLLSRPPEPHYQGKPLSYWLQGFDFSMSWSPAVSRAEARSAVLECGSDAIPLLLQLARTVDSPLKTRAKVIVQKSHLLKVDETPAVYQRDRAVNAFSVLAGDSSVSRVQLASTVPALIQQ